MNADTKTVVGLKQAGRALRDDRVQKLLIAKDADEFVLRSIKELAKEKKVEITEFSSMRELGEFCKIDVGAAVAAQIK